MNKQRNFNLRIVLELCVPSENKIQIRFKAPRFFSLLRGEKMSEGQMRGDVLVLLQVQAMHNFFIQSLQAGIAKAISIA